MFIDTANTKTGSATPETFDAKMDAMLAASKMRMQNRHHEGYAKVKIAGSDSSFRKYSVGQVVDVVHLKDDPSSARLVEDIE